MPTINWASLIAYVFFISKMANILDVSTYPVMNDHTMTKRVSFCIGISLLQDIFSTPG